MKNILFTLLIFFCSFRLQAQCPAAPQLDIATINESCTTPLVINQFFFNCQTICVNAGVAANGAGPATAPDCGATPGSSANDVWLFARDPYTGYGAVPGFDGSLVFAWQNYPGYPNTPPTVSIHIGAYLSGIPFIGALSADCPDGFTDVAFTGQAYEVANVFCDGSPTLDNNQLVAGPGTIPNATAVSADYGDSIGYWFQITPNPLAPSVGDYCFDISPYSPGFICADPTLAPLLTTPNPDSVSATIIGTCLCNSAANGGLYSNSSNPAFNPGVISPFCSLGSTNSVAWFKVTVPYDCARISATITNGIGNFNMAILSNVDCPISSIPAPAPLTGTLTVNEDSLNTDRVIESGGCRVANASLFTGCRALPAGDYWVCISGETNKTTFDVRIDAINQTPEVGVLSTTALSACAGSPLSLNVTGSNLPAASCGQAITWKYSTTAGFNPLTSGTTLGTGALLSATTPAALSTCTPTLYYIKAYIDTVGTTPNCYDVTAEKIITVYPSLSTSYYTASPSADGCSITFTPTCPSNTIDGSASIIENNAVGGIWTTTTHTLTNPLAPAGCTSLIIPTQTITCAAVVCIPPIVTITNVLCNATATGYTFDVTITGGSSGNTYTLTDNDPTTNYGAILFPVGSITNLGVYSNSSTVIITATQTDDATCNSSSSSVATPCSCPSITTATADAAVYCNGDDVFLNATINNPSGTAGSINWIDELTGDVIALGANTTISASTTFCTPVVLPIHAAFVPSSGGCATAISATFSITVFPSANPSYVYSNAGCTVTMTESVCPSAFTITGGNTASNVYDALDPSSGNVNFTFTPSLGSPCGPQVEVVAYNCGGSCPVFISAGSDAAAIECSGALVTLSIAVLPIGEAVLVSWAGPYGFSSNDINPVVVVNNDKCFIENQSFVYIVTCLQDGSTLASGSVPITVFPAATYNIFGANTCSVSVTTGCVGDIGAFSNIYWGGDSANGNTFTTTTNGDNGTLIYTLEHATGLCPETITVPYDCVLPCVAGANGVCSLNAHSKALPYVCQTATAGVYATVDLYDAVTGAGMSIASDHEVGFILTNANTYTLADFQSGVAPVLLYSMPVAGLPYPTGNFGSDSVSAAYLNVPLYVYAVSLEAPFAAFQWSSSSCAKLSTPVPVTFLRPIVAIASTACNSGNAGFTVNGGLNAFNASLPSTPNVTLSNGTSTFFPTTITNISTTAPYSFVANFSGITPAGSSAFTFAVTDANGCRVSQSVSCVLSIRLMQFDGQANDHYNMITWSTMLENENDYFMLEESTDGINFKSCAKVMSQGNSNDVRYYEVKDAANLANLKYYRLVIINKQGEAELSDMITIVRGHRSEYQLLSIRPQPASDMVFLDIKSPVADYIQFEIKDLNGRMLRVWSEQIAPGTSAITVPIESLGNGLYFITISGSRGTSTHRLLKE